MRKHVARHRSMAEFEPGAVRPVALWETIAAALRRAIVLGELQPGVHLEEPALAQKFAVSRVPVREAMARLAGEGLIRSEPRRGAFVIGFSPEDITDLYECRRLVELAAIRHAAERIDGPGLARLSALVQQMDAALQRKQLHLVADPDVEFHRQTVAAAGNKYLLSLWQPMAGLIGTILSITDTSYRDMPRAVASHRSIVDALAARAADRAVHLLQEHLDNGEAVMREALRATTRGEAAATGRADGHYG